MKEKTLRIIVFLVLMAVLITLSLLAKNIFLGETEKKIDKTTSDIEYEESYLASNCNCLERNRFLCGFEGFEYTNGTCRNNLTLTNPITKCSKYDCNGYEVEFVDEKWIGVN